MENIKKGSINILIRKSIFLFILILLKIIILITLEIIILYSINLMILNLGKEFNILYLFLLYTGSITIYIIIITGLTFYFYNMVIISEDRIYRLKLGLLFYEDIDIIEIYRVQEIKAKKEGFFYVIFNIGDLHLVEQKDTEKIIHFIDNPSKIAMIVEKCKENIIYKRDKKG